MTRFLRMLPTGVGPAVFRSLLGAVLAGSASACIGPLAPKSCTAIGCDSGIELAFDVAPPPGTIIELDSHSGFPWRVECGVDWDCNYNLVFAGFTPDQVTIRVATPDAEMTTSLRPTYQKFQPNGSDCPPTCWYAILELALPTIG